MKSHLALLSLVSLFTFSAAAVDVSQCPSRVELSTTVNRVYASSIYSRLAGWEQAQARLQATTMMNNKFRLVRKTNVSCIYSDNKNNQATLTTTLFRDPEESSPVATDQLIVNYKLGQSSFSTFIPVKTYATTGVELYSNPFTLKIKANLRNTTGRPATVDMGMIAVSIR